MCDESILPCPWSDRSAPGHGAVPSRVSLMEATLLSSKVQASPLAQSVLLLELR